MSSALLQQTLDAATRESGISDFGPDDFLAPLGFYLDLIESTPLDEAGRAQQGQLIRRCLVNRARFAQDLLEHPEILDEDVSDPIVVLGFPRSGTTVLQRMMASDPAMHNLALWRVLNPAPFPAEPPGHPVQRIAFAQATEDYMRTHAPAQFTVHPMITNEAEEDWFLHHLAFQHVGNVFWGVLSRASDYLAYLRTLPRLPTYRYVADLLRYLQWQDGGRKDRRWILKTPVHIGCLEEIRTVHPGATFVYPRRDYTTVVASFCHALECSAGTTSASDPLAIGELAMDFWSHEMQRFHGYRAAHPDLPITEIDYLDLLGDPIRHIRGFYEKAGTILTPDGEEAIRAWINDNPAGKHGSHVYDLERYGLATTQVEDVFGSFH